MWPFKSDPLKKEVAELKAFRDIGETFRCEGKTYRVKAHTQYLPMVGLKAVLVCEYSYNSEAKLMRTFGTNNLAELRRQNVKSVSLD